MPVQLGIPKICSVVWVKVLLGHEEEIRHNDSLLEQQVRQAWERMAVCPGGQKGQ